MVDNDIQMIMGIAKVRDDEQARELSIESLYDQYAKAMFRYALTLTSSAEDAQDAVQEVFISIARDIRRINKISNMKSYIFSATRNAAYTQLRSKKRRNGLQQAVCDDFRIGLEEETGSKESASIILRETFSTLPVDQREVLLLKVFDEMTFKEIARTIGVSINTVASRYRYGIERLRQALEVNNNE